MTWATIKGFARWVVASTTWLCGYCLLTQHLGNRRTARILCYHGINDYPTNRYAVPLELFESQMRLLAEQYEVLSMDRLVSLLREDEPIPPRTVAITIDDGFRDAYTHAYPVLRRLALPATLFVPVDLVGTVAPAPSWNPLPQAEFLSWDQLREMSRHGINIGSHALTHTSLTKLTPREIGDQLHRSRLKLEHELGQRVTGFAYPYGTFRDMSMDIQQLVAAAGYSWAVSAISGLNHSRTNALALRRIEILQGDGMFLFAKALQGALDPWMILQAGAGLWAKTERAVRSAPKPGALK